jgi:hypothetical protein
VHVHRRKLSQRRLWASASRIDFQRRLLGAVSVVLGDYEAVSERALRRRDVRLLVARPAWSPVAERRRCRGSGLSRRLRPVCTGMCRSASPPPCPATALPASPNRQASSSGGGLETALRSADRLLCCIGARVRHAMYRRAVTELLYYFLLTLVTRRRNVVNGESREFMGSAHLLRACAVSICCGKPGGVGVGLRSGRSTGPWECINSPATQPRSSSFLLAFVPPAVNHRS